MYNKVKTKSEITNIRVAGQMTAEVLDFMRTSIKPGVTTKWLADRTAKKIKDIKADAVLLGYEGFPDVVCICLNDEVVHGVPSAGKMIEEGDVASFDLCLGYKGMIADAAITTVVGDGPTSGAVRKLLSATQESLSVGVSVVRDGVKTGNIGEAVEQVLLRNGLGVIKDLVGHGVGHEVHESPEIPNYGSAGTGPELVTGMTIAIEPMSTLGSEEVYLTRDGWTYSTRDGSLSAQFEHTVLITENGCEILTKI